MHSGSVARKPRRLLALSAAAVAAIAAGTLSASPAGAATSSTGASAATSGTGVSLSLSPRSGSDYSTDAATLSWTVPSACVGQEVDAFLYKGTGRWNKTAINTAEGNNGGQTTYFDFSSNHPATATGSASWPNVSPGYYDYGESTVVVYPTTAALIGNEGTGLYTIAIACVNGTTYTPILNSSGDAIARSFVLDIGATGNSWKVLPGLATEITLTGHGTADANTVKGHVSLTAHVTASNSTVPAGGVNFYAATGPGTSMLLNSTPAPVASNGTAHYSGPNGFPSGVVGNQTYYAEFVPADPDRYTSATVTAVVNLIMEWVTLKVTATKDSSSATSLDLIAHEAGTPTNLLTLEPQSGVNFVVDGNVISQNFGDGSRPFPFNADGYASYIVTGLKPGTHTITAQLTDANDDPLVPAVGFVVTVNTVKKTIS
jgi:hypothetical protein